MKTVALDFDGVIHAYDKGWHDGTIYGELIPGALEGIKSLMGECSVFIFTTRDTRQVAEWMTAKTGIMTHVDLDPERTFWNLEGRLLATNRKLAAVAYVDDRAVRFESWSQTMQDLDNL